MPCTRAPVIPNGYVVGVLKDDPYKTGERLPFQCNQGYVSPLSLFVRCQQDGTWEEARCIPQSCGDPGHVDHADRQGLAFTYPSSVTYKCHRGYVSSHPKLETFCAANGRWSPSVSKFSCSLLQCPIPLAVPNGYLSYRGRTVDSVVTHICDPGFNMKGEPDRICMENGQWSGSDPQCIPITCGNPGPYPGGVLEPDLPVYTINNLVIFRCGNQHILSKCVGQDKWSNVPDKPCDEAPLPTQSPALPSSPNSPFPPELPAPPTGVASGIPSSQNGFMSSFKHLLWVKVLVCALLFLSVFAIFWRGMKTRITENR